MRIGTTNDKFFCLYVHDNKGYYDNSPQVLFLCTIDWAKFKAALKEIGCPGIMSLESGAYGREK